MRGTGEGGRGGLTFGTDSPAGPSPRTRAYILHTRIRMCRSIRTRRPVGGRRRSAETRHGTARGTLLPAGGRPDLLRWDWDAMRSQPAASKWWARRQSSSGRDKKKGEIAPGFASLVAPRRARCGWFLPLWKGCCCCCCVGKYTCQKGGGPGPAAPVVDVVVVVLG